MTDNERDWNANRKWFKRFETDAKEVFIALEEWQWEAICLLSRVGREENAQQLPNVDSAGPVVTPRWFIDLTDLLVTWCDESRKVVDATPLLQFREYVLEFGRRGAATMSPSFFVDLEKILWQCLDVIDRIRHRVAVKSNAGNLAQEESGTDGTWVDGTFGISVNLQHRRVRREGYSATIDLDTKSLWPVFLALLEAKGEPADLERMRSTYPGKWNGKTRAQIYRRLRKLLEDIGMTVKQRRLKPLDC